MRVIGGRFKGQRLLFIKSAEVRPMSQLVREAIFDILQDRIEGADMLDLFCGSGSVGIEALSRGARHVDFIDLKTEMVKKNVDLLDLRESTGIFRIDALRSLEIMHKKEKKYDFIFSGAPYRFSMMDTVLNRIDKYGILRSGGVMMTEHSKGSRIFSDFQNFEFKKRYLYGQTEIVLYEKHDQEDHV